MPNRPMTAEDISVAISRRQAAAYRRRPEVRSRLAEGQRMARSGQLAWRARGAVDREPAPELAAVRRDALRRGRQTRERQREDAVQARLPELGHPGLGEYLRATYVAGASLAGLRAATGLGTLRLREVMAAAGILIRRPGDTTPSGRRSRAQASDRAAAERVGMGDIAPWLAEQYAAGSSLSGLAMAVGHSSQWVRWRLAHSAAGASSTAPSAQE